MIGSARRMQWIWTAVSGGAIGVGAAVAVAVYPQAGFAQNPTGQFGWHLAEFALMVGAPIAFAQWLALQFIITPRTSFNRLRLGLWVPVTWVGVALMILPLWWWDASLFVEVPGLVILPLLPGAVALGFGQRIILDSLNQRAEYWVLLTILGTVIGGWIGLVIAFYSGLQIETVWAIVTGAGLGVFQGHALTVGGASGHRET